MNEFDDTGEVFGRPDQVELDVIIKNRKLVICRPMVDDRAKPVAQKLGIELYSSVYSYDDSLNLN